MYLLGLVQFIDVLEQQVISEVTMFTDDNIRCSKQ